MASPDVGLEKSLGFAVAVFLGFAVASVGHDVGAVVGAADYSAGFVD